MKNLSRFFRVAALLIISLFAASGCQPSGRDPYAPVLTGPQFVRSEILGYSVQNRPIELITIGTGVDTVLIIATIHGNEDAGTPLVHRLIDRLRIRPGRQSGWLRQPYSLQCQRH